MLADGPRFPSSSTAPTPGRGASCERRSTDFGAHPRNRGQVLYTSQRTARPRGGALFPIQASCRVLRPRLDTRWHRGGDTRPDRIKEALPGTAPFFSMQAARSGIGTARRLLLRPVGRPRWRPPLSECALPRPSWRGVRRIPRKRRARRPLSRHCSSKHRRRSGFPRSAWRGAPFPRGHSWRRLRPARTFSDDRPGWWARPGAAPPSSDSASRQPTGRGEAFDRYRDPRMAPRQAPAHSTGHDPTSLSPRLARRLLFTWLSAPRRWSPRGFTTRSDRA
jgi:hypothetical protein